MAIAYILLVLLFSIILSIIEIPKMIKNKLKKELWTFSILLIFGVTVAILKILDIPLLNPFALLEWIYKPVVDLLKPILE